MKYLEHFHPFRINHGLPENNTTEVVDFPLSLEYQRHIFHQKFDSTTKIQIDLIEFCKLPDTAEENIQNMVDGTHPNKKPN